MNALDARRDSVPVPSEAPDLMADTADVGDELLVFRVGGERFAMRVDAVEAVSELPGVNRLPTMPPHMLGVCELRGSLVPVYSPAGALNVPLGAPAVAIIAWVGRTETDAGRRVAIAVDEAAGVTTTHAARWGGIGGAPGSDGFVRGVSAFGTELTTLIHAGEFLAACTVGRSGSAEEAA
jgi:purine-binding chemotaxis protein CheW